MKELNMLNKIKSIYQSIKDWFKSSETIFLARLETLSGVVLGGAAGIDWTSLMAMDWSKVLTGDKTVWLTAGGMFIHGLILEIARRRNSDL